MNGLQIDGEAGKQGKSMHLCINRWSKGLLMDRMLERCGLGELVGEWMTV